MDKINGYKKQTDSNSDPKRLFLKRPQQQIKQGKRQRNGKIKPDKPEAYIEIIDQQKRRQYEPDIPAQLPDDCQNRNRKQHQVNGIKNLIGKLYRRKNGGTGKSNVKNIRPQE